MENRWLVKTPALQQQVDKLDSEFRKKKEKNLHPVLLGLLIQRGTETLEQAMGFFNPRLADLHDPFLMQDMDMAVARVLEAIEKKEKILILGDYDVDGTTSAATMYMFLQSLSADCEYYIPDRYNEGYGISMKSVEFAAKNNFKVFISLDCGIKANDKIEFAVEKNIDVIICDHHTPEKILPPAYAVLDAKRKDCNYPFKELSGCGVGFKLIQALLQKMNLPKERAYDYLDLLATSIGADIVSMTGENRILARFGLEKINTRPSAGILAIKELAKFQKEFSISDVVFKIAPRINAAGRMASGNKAVELLISQDERNANSIVTEINQYNLERGIKDKSISEEALALLLADPLNDQKKTTVLYRPEWHKGVIGIVASRMIDSFYRPTIIFTGKEGVLSGSARSVKGFSVYEAIEACSDLLLQFGGHMYAAGMTMKEENFLLFQEAFEKVVSETIDPELLIPSIDVDYEMPLGEINSNFMNVLKHFAPFGPDNMNPVFKSSGILLNSIQQIGEDKTHLKLSVFDPERPDRILNAIGFGFGCLIEELTEGMPFDMAYTIEENHWNGRVDLQLHIKDIKHP